MSRPTSTRTELLTNVSTNRQVAQTSPGSVSPDAKALDEQIAKGTASLSDGTLYGTKDASSQRIVKIFETQDDERAGVTNVAQAKTAKNQNVLVGAIQLLAATSTVDINNDPTTLSGLNFGSIAAVKGMEHGELTIRHNGKVVLNRFPLSRFKNSDNDRENAVGEVTLDNVIIIYPQMDIEATIDWGTPMPNRTAVKLLLVGTQTIPA